MLTTTTLGIVAIFVGIAWPRLGFLLLALALVLAR